MMCKRNGGDGVSAYTKRGGGRGLPVTWKQEKIVKTRDRHRLFVCVSATAGLIALALERAHHTRALDSSTREKTKKKKKQLELSIRDMIIWFAG